MIGNDYPDKVTEYHILNAQLMSKAMLLLDTASDIMTNADYDKSTTGPAHQRHRDEFMNSTLEYYKPESVLTAAAAENGQKITEEDEEIALNDDENDDGGIINENGKKFSFPHRPDELDLVGLYNTTFLRSSISENDEDTKNGGGGGSVDIKAVDQTESLVGRLLKTKISLKENGCAQRKSISKEKSIELRSPEKKSGEDRVGKSCASGLKVKCEQLTEELRGIQEKLRKKITECDELTKTNQSLQENKMRLLTQINNLKSQALKRDGKIATLNSKIQIVETECQSVKNERDLLLKNAKGVSQEISGTEIRLTRALKDIASLKEELSTCKQEEKEIRETSRKQIEKLNGGLKMAEKREKNLLTAIKKQALLMDNLKKQINYLTLKKELEASEKQLDSILKWENK